MDTNDRSSGSRLDALPVHPMPEGVAEHPVLIVDGLVERPLRLTPEDLAALPAQPLTSDFRCSEGWTVPDLAWRGVPVREVLRLAGVDPAARWVQASAEAFSTPLPRAAADDALLALALDGRALPREHGGPVRLVVPGGACFTSVKWLDHLEVRAAPAPDTARQIALDRLGAVGARGD